MYKSVIFLLIFSILVVGCDSDGGDDLSTPFVGSGNSAAITAPPTGTGNGPSVSLLNFTPAVGTLVVDTASPDVVITANGAPGGGTYSLSNINGGGTGGTFIPGPNPNQFTFTSSVAFVGGLATVDVLYTPPAPNFPVSATYSVVVNFSGTPAGISFSPAPPITVQGGGPDDVITVTGTPAGGTIALSNIMDGGTGGTFVAGPGALDFTYTTSTAFTAGTASVDVTYTPPLPDIPVTATYTLDVLTVFTAMSPNTPIAIPTPSGTVTDTFTIPQSLVITDVRMQVDILHVFLGNVTLTLTSPGGTTQTLKTTSTGSSFDDMEVIFDDAAATPLLGSTFPILGFLPRIPEGAGGMAVYDGENTMGDWDFTITDSCCTTFPTQEVTIWGLAFNGDTSVF